MLASLKNKIRQQTTQFGTGKVGVYLASFDGAKDLFRQAAADPVNSSVRWFGGDGLALSSALLSDARASSFAASVQFFAPGLRLPQPAHPGLTAVMGAIKNKTGLEADAYALAAYDALWVIARTVSAFPEPPGDFDTVKDVFQKEAAQYYGLTGPIHLNAAGDRSFGAFNYWGIVNEGGSYIWKWVGQSL